ncbi:MAG: NAD-dependent epimerase [Chlamydiales bacterium]
MSQKSIFITGIAGFIGFHLAKTLLERGDSVIGIDNFNDYYTPSLKRQRAKILEDLGINVIEGDICNTALIEKTLQFHQCTHIAHMAAQAGVRYSLQNPQIYIKTNVEGFLSILEICRKNPKIPLIYASSSSVYGLNTKVPFSTTDRTDEQASLYGVTKKSNELMAQTYHHLFGLNVTGLRFFTVYGPWGRPDMAYYSFANAIMEGKTIDVFNHGKLQRDFTYIDDIISGAISAIDRSAPHAIYNLGNHQPVTLEEFIATLEEALGKRAHKRYLPMQPGDVYTTYADIQESAQELGYQPKTSLREGIHSFVNWYLKFHKIKI